MDVKKLKLISVVLLIVSGGLLITIWGMAITKNVIPDLLWNAFMVSVIGAAVASLTKSSKEKKMREQFVTNDVIEEKETETKDSDSDKE